MAVSSMLLPRLLGPTEFGEYSLILAVSGLVAIGTQIGLPQAVRKFVADLHSTGKNALARKLVTKLVIIQSGLAVLGCLAMLAIQAFLIHDAHMKVLAILLAFGALPSVIAAIYINAMNGMEMIDTTSKIGGALGVITTTANIIVLLKGGGSVGILLVLLVANTVYLIVTVIFYFRAMKASAPAVSSESGDYPRLGRAIALYSIGATAAGICTVVALDKSEIYFLRVTAGIEGVAMYALAFNLAQKVLMIPTAWAGVLIPAFAKRSSQGDTAAASRLYHESIKSYFLVMTPFSLLMSSQATWLIKLLYGEQYLPASTAFSIAMLTVPSAAFSVPAFSVIYGINGMTRKALAYMLIPVLLDLLLSATLIPKFGVTGAALANLVTQWSMAFFLARYISNEHKFFIPKRHLLRVLACSVVPGLLCFFAVSLIGTKVGFVTMILGALSCLLALRHLNVFAEFAGLEEYAGKIPGKSGVIAKRLASWLMNGSGKAAAVDQIAKAASNNVAAKENAKELIAAGKDS
jgi:O-antigen/teichoic acid export membrane protein